MKSKNKRLAWLARSRGSYIAISRSTLLLPYRLLAAVLACALLVSGVLIVPTEPGKTISIDEIDLTAPETPRNFIAESRDAQIHLEWVSRDPSDVARYKVYISSTEEALDPVYTEEAWYDINGLNNGTTYRVAVTALDASENESAPTGVIALTPSAITSATQKKYSIQPWVPTSEDVEDAREAYFGNIDLYDISSPFWFNAEMDGGLSAKGGARDQDFINQSHAAGVKVLPTITNNYSLEKGNALLASPSTILRHIEVIVNEVLENNYDGIDIDYENVAADKVDAYTFFVNNLAHQLHSNNKLLVVTSQAKLSDNYAWNGPGAIDWETIAPSIDYLRIMLYDYSRPTTEPGPIGPKDWIRKSLEYAKTKIDPSKVIAGIPFYGYDWALTPEGETSGLVWDGVQRTKEKYALSFGWDEAAGEGYYTYTDEVGPRKAYYQDALSIEQKLQTVVEAGVGGIAIWRLGSEDPANFDMIRKYLGKHLIVESPAKVRVVPKDQALSVVWTPNSNNPNVAYNLYFGTDADHLEKVATTSETNYVFDHLTNGQSYSIRITAQDSRGTESAPTNFVTAAPTDLITAVPVTNLSVAQANTDQVVLHWTADDNKDFVGRVAGYEVRYAHDPITVSSWDQTNLLPEDAVQNDGNEATATIAGLTPGQEYYAAVKTIDETGHLSALSNVVHVRTKDLTPPTAPQKVEVSVTPGRVHLSWQEVLDTDLMGYKLYYSEGVGTEETLYVGTNTAYDLEFLKPDRVYSFRVSAIDTAGNESTGSIVKVYLPPL